MREARKVTRFDEWLDSEPGPAAAGHTRVHRLDARSPHDVTCSYRGMRREDVVTCTSARVVRERSKRCSRMHARAQRANPFDHVRGHEESRGYQRKFAGPSRAFGDLWGVSTQSRSRPS